MVTLRLLVTNISSSSPTINTAAYYQRCVITCETVAVHRRPRLQHLSVAALTQAVKPDIGSESRFLPTPPAFDAPVRGVPVGILLCRLAWKTRMAWLPDGEKNWWYVYSFWHNSRTWQTDTAWRHRPRLCVASRGKNYRITSTGHCNFRCQLLFRPWASALSTHP